ncbi:MAG TPA: hypothetical protein VK501_06480 [Baekduia sp.]|uniref:hypothetical protein n=1 Tax=Baekduia sp. TaxID=2600305 RepID=UPI002CE101E9|nr:hypothetical protein [Baekduia sp.]HMJ33544.1 hypothetical protein [Baekduia sp.]
MATHAHGLPYEDYEDEPRYAEEDGSAGWWELISLLVLVVAGVGLPVVGWLTGLAMVHQSHAWTRRDLWIAAVGPLPAVVAVVVWSAVDGQALPLHLGPLGVLILLGGAIAGLLGGAYLTVRAFVLA